jgi:hypothetical protein
MGTLDVRRRATVMGQTAFTRGSMAAAWQAANPPKEWPRIPKPAPSIRSSSHEEEVAGALGGLDAPGLRGVGHDLVADHRDSGVARVIRGGHDVAMAREVVHLG